MIRHLLAVAAAACALSASTARATILTFDQDLPISNFENVNQLYGDRVTSTTMPGNLLYDVGAEGFTPNVVVSYGPAGADPALWNTGYGNLTRVLFKDADGFDYLDVTLTADAGYDVLLYGWDMAAFGSVFSSDPTIDALQVFDDVAATTLLDLSNVSISETTHTTFDYSANPFRSNILRLRFDAGNLGGLSDDIAFDNIRFGQAEQANVIPEPASVFLLSTGLFVLGTCTRRRRARVA